MIVKGKQVFSTVSMQLQSRHSYIKSTDLFQGNISAAREESLKQRDIKTREVLMLL